MRHTRSYYLWVSPIFILLMIASLSQPLSAQKFSKTDVVQHLEKNLKKLNLQATDVDEMEVLNAYEDRHSKLTHIYLRQQYNGIPIRSGRMGVHFKQNGEVLHLTNEFVSNVENKIENNPVSLNQKQAIEAAANTLNLPITSDLNLIQHEKTSATQTMFSKAGLSREAIPVRAVYDFNKHGKLRLAWETEIYQLDQQNWWVMRMDATTGEELSRYNYVNHCSWEDPNEDHSTHQHFLNEVPKAADLFQTKKEVTPQNLVEQVTKNTAETSVSFDGTYNAFPMPIESPRHGTRSPLTGLANAEASPHGWHDDNGAPTSVEYTWTQGNNVKAYYAPNTSPTTDANEPLAIPGVNVPDGGQSLMFTANNNLNQLVAPNFRDDAITNLFVWNNFMHDVTYLYGFDEVSGNFQTTNHTGQGVGGDYVRAEAQDGGGTDNANFATPGDGSRPTMQMFLWTTNATGGETIDGDFDGGVICHEYGHGVSQRLVGGALAPCLGGGEQGGEGWSDYYGLLLSMKDVNNNGMYEEDVDGEGIRGIGTYVLNQSPTTGRGIRLARYSTDFSINNYTYKSQPDVAAPHGVGFLWCTMLWDLTWDLMNNYGFDEDVYNVTYTQADKGNIRALAIVTHALKLTPCTPSFIDMRDAIFAANEALYPASHVADKDRFWRVFARRGLGFSAAAGGNEAFDLPTFDTKKSVNLEEQGKGKNITYTFSVQNNSDEILSNVVITDAIDSRLSLTNSPDGATETGGVVSFPAFTVPLNQTITKSFTATIDPNTDHTVSIDLNDLEGGQDSEFTATPPPVATLGWRVVSDFTHSGSNAYFHINPEQESVGDLTYDITLDPAQQNALSFWQRLDTEAAFDGGVVEISTNGLAGPFEDLGDKMVVNGYNSAISNNTFGVPRTVLDGRKAFTGFREYFQTIIDLTDYSGDVTLRWRFASDGNTDAVGWWIDDVEILELYHIKNEACVSVDNFIAPLNIDCSNVGPLGTVIRDSDFGGLAVDLIEFKATPQQKTIRLDWLTANEIDHAGFELYRRSATETEFKQIAYVKEVGSVTDKTAYHYIDEDVATNVRYYYQLKMIALDGKASESDVVAAIIKKETTAIALYPNPTKDQVSIAITGDDIKGDVTVEIMSVDGQLVRQLILEANGQNVFDIDLSDLAEQIYLLRIQTGETMTVERLVIQR